MSKEEPICEIEDRKICLRSDIYANMEKAAEQCGLTISEYVAKVISEQIKKEL